MASDPERLKKQREVSIVRVMTQCRFFTGTSHECCKADVNYRAIVGGPDLGWGLRLPCYPPLKHEPAIEQVTCEKREYPTREEAERREDEDEASMERFGRAHKAAKHDARTKGYKKNHGGVSQCACPICGGVLHYSVASYNGHMHGKCETPHCVSWME